MKNLENKSIEELEAEIRKIKVIIEWKIKKINDLKFVISLIQDENKKFEKKLKNVYKIIEKKKWKK